MFPNNEREIEEYTIDEQEPLIRLGLYEWSIRFDDNDTNISYCTKTGEITCENDSIQEREYKSGTLFRWVNVLAKDEEHARKIAIDKLNIYLANKENIT